ncbi:stationary-phase-induced ribosome-associated protein [Providencia hangzhouensis]|uniref:stationary-phase-induced ribosome-associated protein n=1 Tax=Providencia hangzhouensis TaxID=3031799 RepID=UPI0034DDB7E3
MVSNNNARRLLGMPYKLSRSKKTYVFRLVLKIILQLQYKRIKRQKRRHIIQ